jgi:hypothetical protein
MRWMIGGQGWPIAGGALLLPPGTIIDSTTWTGPLPMPIDVISLDAAAFAQMQQWYGATAATMVDQRHRLLKAPGV